MTLVLPAIGKDYATEVETRCEIRSTPADYIPAKVY